MAERLSALAHHSATAAGDARVSLSEARPGSILQVEAWPDTLDTVRRVIAEMLGVGAPTVGRAATGSGATVAAIAPGRFLIAAEAGDLLQRFEAALPSGDAAVADLSHGRVILKLEGEAAAAVLSTSVALDLDPSTFPVGRVAQTMIHHVDVVIHRRAETYFELWVLRSFAGALAEWLLDASAESGIAFART